MQRTGDRGCFFFFFSCRQREEHTRALTPGDILRVMNMIIGQGTVSKCDSERASDRGDRERGEREEGGEGEEREERRERRRENGREGKKRGEEKRRREKGEEERRGEEGRSAEERSGVGADPAKLFCATALARLQWCIISERSLG